MIKLFHNIFFKPREKFSQWKKKQKIIIDCGAGVGLLGKLYPKKVFCIDLFERNNSLSQVFIQDALTFKFPKDSVILIARPSNGEWIQSLFLKAIHLSIPVFYVGVARNFDDHLYGFNTKTIMKNVGEDNEDLLEIIEVNTFLV